VTLEARFRLRHGEFELDTEFEAPARGVTALFGPSGAGKTLLLRAIAGLERAPGGFFRVGTEIWQGPEVFVPTHRRPLGYVFQEASLFGHLTVAANLHYAERRRRGGSKHVDRRDVVRLLGIESLLDRRPAGLSGGERQRVAIARALLTGPRLLLMDEPLSALDLAGRAEIFPFLEDLHRTLDVPILYVSHAVDEVARLADHLVLLDGGRVSAAGGVTEMLTRTDLPLAGTDEAASVVEASVVEHDAEHALTYLAFPGGRFIVAGSSLDIGTAVRVRVLARDVSLTLARQEGTSILNIFPARIDEMRALDASQVAVRLDLAGVGLLSKITRKSAQALELEPGKELFVQIKAVALLR
jgi:molybdate transport system ATP-binding protein